MKPGESDPVWRLLLIELQEWIRRHCAPVVFRNEDGKRINGSMTFVDTGEMIVGITAGHVADRILECCDGAPGNGCQVGFAELDPGRLIARHPVLDLATFELSDVFVTSAHCDVASVASWPPQPPENGERVLVGGYPGVFRVDNDSERQIEFAFAHFGTRASDVEAERFVIGPLNLETAFGLRGERIDLGIELGGMSGGCVFRMVEGEDILSRPELVGIIYSGCAPFETLFAHPLSSVKANGEFIGADVFTV